MSWWSLSTTLCGNCHCLTCNSATIQLMEISYNLGHCKRNLHNEKKIDWPRGFDITSIMALPFLKVKSKNKFKKNHTIYLQFGVLFFGASYHLITPGGCSLGSIDVTHP